MTLCQAIIDNELTLVVIGQIDDGAAVTLPHKGRAVAKRSETGHDCCNLADASHKLGRANKRGVSRSHQLWADTLPGQVEEDLRRGPGRIEAGCSPAACWNGKGAPTGTTAPNTESG